MRCPPSFPLSPLCASMHGSTMFNFKSLLKSNSPRDGLLTFVFQVEVNRSAKFVGFLINLLNEYGQPELGHGRLHGNHQRRITGSISGFGSGPGSDSFIDVESKCLYCGLRKSECIVELLPGFKFTCIMIK
jgi:hypothetical protein